MNIANIQIELNIRDCLRSLYQATYVMSSNPSFEWQKIQDVYYNLQTCYGSLDWKTKNLHSSYRIAVSTHATLIALASKFVKYPNVIDIYSLSGSKIWSVVYNNTPESYIVDYDFRDEDLCIVFNDQKLRYYEDFKGSFKEHKFTSSLKSLKLTDNGIPVDSSVNGARGQYITNLENDELEEIVKILGVNIWGKYLTVRLPDKIVITDLDTLTNYSLSIQSFDADKIYAVRSLLANEHSLTLLVSYDTTMISIKVDLEIESYEILDHGLTDGPFDMIAASPNGQLVSLFNRNVSTIFVINKNFDQVLLEYSTAGESIQPFQIEWCGNDAITLSLRDEIRLIGPEQMALSFFYDIESDENFDIDMLLRDSDDLSFTAPILKTGNEGLKAITATKVELLRRVPQVSIDLYSIGSSHPSSILLDCVDKLSKHASKADANISLLESDDSLMSAIDSCLDASREEFDVYWQKRILRAVSFGKAYKGMSYDSEKYLECINFIKVLNQLRSPDIGIFLTYQDIESIGWKQLTKMLLRRDLHFLALNIFDLLSIPDLQDDVYIDWCCQKIKKELTASNGELFKQIEKKLLDKQVSVSRICETAHQEGRMDLCRLLIDLEPTINKRMSQFLKYGDVEICLLKSFQAGDYDLSKLLLLHLKNALTTSQFFKIVKQNTKKAIFSDADLESLNSISSSKERITVSGDFVRNFWIESIGRYDNNALESFYKIEDRKLDIGLFKLKQAKKEEHELYKSKILDVMNNTTDKKLMKFYQRELDLFDLQTTLGETYHADFFEERTLTDIIRRLVKMHQLKQATKVIKRFKVSQEKYWYLVVQTYSQLREFDKLHQFLAGQSTDFSEVKSPIGFKSIIDYSITYNAPKQYISAYIKNYSEGDYSERISLFMQNGEPDLAATEAYKHKDVNALRMIQKSVSGMNTPANDLIKSYIAKLGY